MWGASTRFRLQIEIIPRCEQSFGTPQASAGGSSAPAAALVEYGFFTVETLWWRRFYMLFLIELSRRDVDLAGITADPDAALAVWETGIPVTQVMSGESDVVAYDPGRSERAEDVVRSGSVLRSLAELIHASVDGCDPCLRPCDLN